MKNNEKPKSTADEQVSLTSFYPAVFLYAKGFRLLNIIYTTPKRAQFVFKDRPDRRDLIQAFNFSPENSPEVMVDARNFVAAIKSLKDRLYQEKELV